MRAYLLDKEGKATELPPLFSYRMKYGSGEPCDAFEVSCEYSPEMENALYTGCRFLGAEGHETVFSGIVDEYEAELGEAGRTLSLAGRGMAARLLDNEAEAACYEYCTVETVIRHYVKPCGVTDVVYGDMGCCRGFAVESGESCWKAVSDFAWFVGGVRPRFSRSGRLLLRKTPGERRSFGPDDIVSFKRNSRRYGIVSEAVVRSFDGRVIQRTENRPFLERGGSARRIVTRPRKPGFDRARYSGEYQIRRSEENKETFTVRTAAPFAAFPGDTVELTLPAMGAEGLFEVIETESRADASCCGTEIVMIRGGET
ncbi:MAG: hypothetical protein IK136_02425 [Oscillospiraceae bacterium]|nr:hypothetical protein [Oscillospiraceae bacterium]